MGNNKSTNSEKIESLDDTMVFNVEPTKDTKEMNVIKEKSLVVDFTSPVDVLSDDADEKGKKKNIRKPNKKKMKFKPFAKIASWWSGLSKLKKIIICLISFLVVVFLVLLVLVFNKKDEKKKEKLPDVILEQENYTYKNGTLVFLDNAKKEIGSYKCKNKDEKKCFVAYKSNEDDFIGDQYLNQDGTKIESRASIINGNYVFVIDNKKGSKDDIILYSIKSENNIDEYKLVKQSSINKNLVVLKDKEGKYGALDLSDSTPKTAINFLYDYVGFIDNEMSNKYLVINKNNKYYVTDFNENLVSSGFNEKIVDYNDNFIVVKTLENYYKIYDYEGNELTPNNYLFIKINGDYYAALLDNGIIVYDKEGIKYNEIPIGLTSTNYNRTYVFDANKQLISNDVAFEMEVNEEYISITRGKANDLLSISEAKANKGRPFVSYYSGILYFYSDAEKNNQIGKYTCRNKNSTVDLEHCNVASTVVISKNDVTYDISPGIVAILNNRFVFINDTISTPNIYLYDLNTNKKMGPYTSIETSGLMSVNFDSKSADGSLIIAKNAKDQYGLLKINKSSVDIVLNFEYSELEKAGENYIAKKSDGKYYILGKDGKEKSKAIPDKIMSYNDKYIATKSSLGYKVYDYDGNVIDSKGYTYVRLDREYYIAILTNNTLEVHEYAKPGEETKTIKFEKEIKVKPSESWKADKSFKVESILDKYRVTIKDGNVETVYISITEEAPQTEPVIPVNSEAPKGNETNSQGNSENSSTNSDEESEA